MEKFTHWLLGESNPAEWLKIADIYIQSKQELGSNFIIPTEHKVIEPLIDMYADDRAEFVKYILSIRDAAFSSKQKKEIHEFYRTILTRDMQSNLRARVNKALKKYQKIHKKTFTPDQKIAYKIKLNSQWSLERLEYMKVRRGHHKRLTTEERADALSDFWNEIEDKIDKGILPDE